MRAPDGLGAAGKKAWKRALAALPDAPDDRYWDAAARYARVTDRAELARREWEDAGGPLICEQSNGVISEHPLLKVLGVLERDAARYAAACCLEPAKAAPKRARGRPPGAASAPDRAAEPGRVLKVA